MNTTLLLLLLFVVPFLAGLTVLFFSSYREVNIKFLLSFSAAFLLTICFVHLLPEVFDVGGYVGLFVLGGFFIQIVLDFFSAGIEHGHIHQSDKQTFPYLIFISLFIHSMIEGIPLVDNSMDEMGTLNRSGALLSGILLHKIPIAAVLTILLMEKRISKIKTIIALAIFALSAPISILLVSYSMLETAWINIHYLTALATGIFLHISTVILFESSKDHRYNFNKIITILVGVLLALATFGSH